MTQQQYRPAAPTPHPPPPTPPTPEFGEEKRPHRGRVLPIITLVVAVAAAVMAGIALARQPSQSGDVAPPPPSTAGPSAAEVAAAKEEACDAWIAASTAMIATRKPFLDKTQPGLTWDWNDPVIASSLAQAQTGILAQAEYLRQHLVPATPHDVAGPVRDFIAANIDLIALDGQHQSAAAANAAANRSNDAAAKIRTACGS